MDVKASYDEKYKEGKLGGADYTHEWILNMLKPGKGQSILDVGCGQGYLLAEAQRLGMDAHGIELSEEGVKFARRNAPSAEVVCGDAHKLRWRDRSFDYVTNIGALEHFERPEECLKEMRRVMKDGATACIMLPNLYYYRHIIDKVLWKKEPTSYQVIERFDSLGGWRRMLEENGFTVLRIAKYNKFNRQRWLVFIRKFIVPLWFSHHFVFVCRKNSV